MDDNQAEVIDTEEGARAFSVFFQQLAHGEAHAKASEELQKIGRALIADRLDRDSKKKAKLTVELTFTYEDGSVVIGHQIKSKLPPEHASKAISFITDGGNFASDNPRQRELPFGVREVPVVRGDVREVGSV